jgi:hypothetical protein
LEVLLHDSSTVIVIHLWLIEMICWSLWRRGGREEGRERRREGGREGAGEGGPVLMNQITTKTASD